MKAAFAQFLSLRHGGHRAALQRSPRAAVPFAQLPRHQLHGHAAGQPAAGRHHLRSRQQRGYTSATYAGDPGVRNPYIYPPGPTSIGPTGAANTVFAPGTLFSGVTTNVTLPPPIPARRLFQIPDAYGTASPLLPPRRPRRPRRSATPATPATRSSTSSPVTARAWRRCPGAVTAGTYYLNNGYPNLVWSGKSPQASPTTTGVYLGSNNGTNPDYSQHPYWRSEMMQKVMNLTTVRTHQYAVWITIGFFEVTRQGDPLMANANPGTSLPPWVSTSSGPRSAPRPARRRGTGASSWSTDSSSTGFDDTTTGSFRPAVVYRQIIE